MRAMKQAFNEALDASAHLTLCESCPLQVFHKLCAKIESKYMLRIIFVLSTRNFVYLYFLFHVVFPIFY